VAKALVVARLLPSISQSRMGCRTGSCSSAIWMICRVWPLKSAATNSRQGRAF